MKSESWAARQRTMSTPDASHFRLVHTHHQRPIPSRLLRLTCSQNSDSLQSFAMSKYCPACHRILYSRRLAFCGFCQEPIPEELRFSPEKIAEMDREIAALEDAHRKRVAAECEERDALRKKQSAMMSFFPPMGF